MSKLTDSNYLRNNQYRNSKNLSARANLHNGFSTSKINWHNWVYQHLNLPDRSTILEIGSGPGYLWQNNKDALPAGWLLHLADLSPGMLEEARAVLGEDPNISYTTLDGASLPFPEGLFDAVIANHVLYHLPDIPSALSEIQRVLAPGGCLYAATNGASHLQEIRSWKEEFLPEPNRNSWGTPTRGFDLKNGAPQLKDFFQTVELLAYQDALEITEVEPIILYIQSYLEGPVKPALIDRLQAFLQGLLDDQGTIKITKETGMFLAVKR